MNSGRSLKLIFNFFMAVMISTLFAGYCFAENNSVSSVIIKQKPQGQYQILLKTDKTAKIKKSFDGNNLMLTVNSALPSDSAEIVYDNAPGIRNVTVQKKNTDNTLIILQGKNIENVEILNKDLSTGKINKADEKNSLFFIADKKLFSTSITAMLFFFIMMLVIRPKEKRYHAATKAVNRKTAREAALTLRHKAMLQSHNIPSINSKSEGSFSSLRMTKPEDFVTSESVYEEKIRKAG